MYQMYYLKMWFLLGAVPRDPVQGAAAKTCTLALHIGDVCLRLACANPSVDTQVACVRMCGSI